MILIITILVGAVLLMTALNVFLWPQPSIDESTSGLENRITVLIPARNEEHNLGPCLDQIVNQPGVMEILVYDDHSSDRTPLILSDYSSRYPLIRTIKASNLEDGWCGKTFACEKLAKEAKGDWLLFLDADVRLSNNAVGVILLEATRRGLSFLSCWPRLQASSLGERILMPMLNFAVFGIFPVPLMLLEGEKFRRQSSLGLAHGACMFFKASEYREFGGHERVKGELFEDTRIAQLWRREGRKGLCLDGSKLLRLRMYSSVGEIYRGFQKNFYPAFQSDLSFLCFLLFHFVAFLLPFILLVAIPKEAMLPVGLVLMVRLLLMVRFGDSIWSVLAFPFAEAFLLAVAISSWWRCFTGKGVGWKGRSYRQLPKGVK